MNLLTNEIKGEATFSTFLNGLETKSHEEKRSAVNLNTRVVDANVRLRGPLIG